MTNSIRVDEEAARSEMSDEIARRSVEARLRVRPLPEFPGRLSETLEQAYALRSASIRRWPGRVAGWKIDKPSPAQREQFGVERVQCEFLVT